MKPREQQISEDMVFYELQNEVEQSDLDLLLSGKLGTWCASSTHLDSVSFGDFMNCVLFLLERRGVSVIEDAWRFFEALQLYSRKRVDIYPEEVFGGAFTGSSGPMGGYASTAEEYFFHNIFGANYIRALVLWEYMRGDLLFLGHSRYVPQVAWGNFLRYTKTYVFPKLKREVNKKYISCILAVVDDIIEHAEVIRINTDEEVFQAT